MAREYCPIENMYPCEELLDNDKDNYMLVKTKCPKLKECVKSKVDAYRLARYDEPSKISLSTLRKKLIHVAEGIPNCLLFENETNHCLCFVPTTVTPGDQEPENVPS